MRTALLSLTMCLLALPANAKYSGGTGEPNDPYQIATAANLIALGETPTDYDKHFVLTADIDLDPNLPGRKVFDRAVIGPTTYPNYPDVSSSSYRIFPGVFDGTGHKILHLTIRGVGNLGLFGNLSGEVKDLGVLEVSITGSGEAVGGLVGDNGRGVVTRCYSSGVVKGDWYVGGLVGKYGYLTQCHSTAEVSGGSHVGGLAGQGGSVTQCYSTGAVSGYHAVGGLLGRGGWWLTQCYSTGAVSGTDAVGGLVGWNGGTVTHCYSTGAVSGSGDGVGGLVGWYDDGFSNPGFVVASFWDIETSGQPKSFGGTGRTTAQMRMANTFLGWGACGGIWTIDEGKDYPHLAWEGALGEIIGGPTYGGGMGTVQSPYLIYTAEQLNTIGLAPCDWGRHFKLMADIDLSALDGKEGRPAFNIIGLGRLNWGLETGDYPVGIPFSGVFDGNRHAVTNFTFTAEADRDFVGLFGYVYDPNAQIKDLRLIDPNVRVTGGYVGCLVGWLEVGSITRCCVENARVEGAKVGGMVGVANDTVTQCYSTGVVTGESCVGGLVGEISWGRDTESYGTVTNCYSSASVSGTGDHVGGLVGDSGGTVTYCYSTGAVDGNDCVGGLVGNSGGTVTYCYSTGAVRASGHRGGGLVGEGSLALHSVWDTETSGLSGSDGGIGLTTAEMRDPYMLGLNGFADDPNWVLDAGRDYPRLAWQGMPGDIIPELVIDWLEGQGTSDAPYQMDTADQLTLLSKASILWDKHFVLNADIDLDPNLPNRPLFRQSPVQLFTGVFEGNGHVISHLVVEGGSYLGLFGQLGCWYAPGAEVKNLGVGDVKIVGSDDNVGGLVGYNWGTLTDCYTTGAVSAGSYVGGLVGANRGAVTGCYTAGSVSGEDDVGGLAGFSDATVTGCYCAGTVSGSERVGGLVGYNFDGTVTRCFSTGAVAGTGAVGGLMGENWAYGRVTQCYSTGAISGTGHVGGLVGSNDYALTDCYSTGAVIGTEYVGGLVGGNSGTVTHCYSTGTVTAGVRSVGGLLGSNNFSYYEGLLRHSFWDIQTSGMSTSAGGTGKATAEMQMAKTFLDAGWDFVGETANGTEDIWWIDEGKDYPRLWWEAK